MRTRQALCFSACLTIMGALPASAECVTSGDWSKTYREAQTQSSTTLYRAPLAQILVDEITYWFGSPSPIDLSKVDGASAHIFSQPHQYVVIHFYVQGCEVMPVEMSLPLFLQIEADMGTPI